MEHPVSNANLEVYKLGSASNDFITNTSHAFSRNAHLIHSSDKKPYVISPILLFTVFLELQFEAIALFSFLN